jgi:hypothetical protein
MLMQALHFFQRAQECAGLIAVFFQYRVDLLAGYVVVRIALHYTPSDLIKVVYMKTASGRPKQSLYKKSISL